jgi:hypothetical protein
VKFDVDGTLIQSMKVETARHSFMLIERPRLDCVCMDWETNPQVTDVGVAVELYQR